MFSATSVASCKTRIGFFNREAREGSRMSEFSQELAEADPRTSFRSFLPQMAQMAADPIQFTTDHTGGTDTDPRIMVLSVFISVIRG